MEELDFMFGDVMGGIDLLQKQAKQIVKKRKNV